MMARHDEKSSAGRAKMSGGDTVDKGREDQRKNWTDTIRQHLKETGISWEEDSAVLTEKTGVNVWSNVSSTRNEPRSAVKHGEGKSRCTTS